MRILFTGKNAFQGLKALDNASLGSTALSAKHALVRDIRDQPDLVICVDWEMTAKSLLKDARSQGIPTVLIMNEPCVVIPAHADSKVLALFDRIIRVGRPPSAGGLPWPQTWRLEPNRGSRANKAVIVNADKWSFIGGQLYWLRAAIAGRNSDIDVYGPGWDRATYARFAHRIFDLGRTIVNGRLPSSRGLRYLLTRVKAHKGTTVDKIHTMAEYKIAIVIENSDELMTEKLFDAFFAGCIPVYVGPPVGKFGIPEELVIQAPPNIQGLNAGISRALEMNSKEYSSLLTRFLHARTTRETWASGSAFKAILESALDCSAFESVPES